MLYNVHCTTNTDWKIETWFLCSPGLDNGGGGPAVATPSKEEKLRTASKKEVRGRKEQDIAKMCDTFIPDNCEEVQSICQWSRESGTLQYCARGEITFFCFSSQLDFCTCRLPSIAVLLERPFKHCRSDINCVFSPFISLLSRTMWQCLKSIFPEGWRWCCF